MAEMPPPIVLPESGDSINERYRVDDKLGKGGMGQVYRVHDLHSQTDVALKYLSVPKDKPTAIDRFKSEFAKLAQFPHPNIAAVYDFGHDEARDLFFFTSELIVGQSFFDGTRGLTPLEIEALVVQTLRALEYLHNHRLVHYDIKPGNVLITPNKHNTGIAKVIDFGVADYGFKGRLVGTPSYMAPEMTRREIPDQRADLYSLGVMWYQVLAGFPESPFRGTNRDETFYNHQTKILPPLTAIHSGIPAYMDRIVTRLLSKRPEDRFPYAAAVISEINLAKDKASQVYEIETRETRQSYIPAQARFVGREDSLGYARLFLQAHLPAATSPSEPQSPRESHDIAWITGAKGVGKTRLLNEMRHTAQLNGFDSVMASADDPATWDSFRSAVAHAIDHPTDPTLFCLDAFDALKANSAAAPLLDDVSRLQNFLVSSHDLGTVSPHLCLVITGTSLPKGTPTQRLLHIPLKPFTDIELTEYVRAVTGFEVPPEGFVEELMRHTEGNPYFVTELMRALIDQNILFDNAGRWKATTFEDLGVDFSTIRIPGSLSDAIAVEYNQLSAPEQNLLALLSVWNAPATPTQLEHVMGNTLDPTTPIKLLKKGWIDMDISSNAMTVPNPNRRMAVEAQQGQPTKEKWHHAIAELLKADSAAEPEHVQWHYAHSPHPKYAIASLWSLAEHYAATQRPIAAITTLLRLTGRNDLVENMRHQAQLLLARTYRNIRHFDEAMAVLEGLDRELRSRGNHHDLHAQIWEEMAITAIRQGKFDAAEQTCMRALQLQQKHPVSAVLRIRTENYLGQLYLARGAVDRAIDTFRRCRDEARQLPVHERSEITNNELCNALFQKGDYADVIQTAEEDMTFYEEASKTRLYLLANLLMANAYRKLKQNQKARAAYQKGIDISRARHDTEYLFHHYHGLGSLCLDLGQTEEALRHYERAIDLAARLADALQLIATKTNVAVLHMKLGKTDSAEREFLAILDHMHHHPPATHLAYLYACRAHLELGDLYVKHSRFGEAKAQLDDAEKLVKKYANCAPLLFSIQLTRAELHRDMGDKSVAKRMIASLRKSARSPEEIHQLDITETTIED